MNVETAQYETDENYDVDVDSTRCKRESKYANFIN